MSEQNVEVAVLAERLENFKKQLDERAVAQKQALDAALIAAKAAVDAALSEKEKSVNAAFAASEKAITKAEDSQREYNKTINALQTEVVSLKVSSSQVKGNSNGMRDMYGWVFGVVMLLVTIGSIFASHWR